MPRGIPNKKPEDTTTVVAAAVEAEKATREESTKKKNLVALEMTEDEKNEFVKWKADKELKDEETPEAPKELMTLDLRFAHYVNFTQYGPGRVTLDGPLAKELLYRDERALQGRLDMHRENKTIVEMAMGGPRKIRPARDGELGS